MEKATNDCSGGSKTLLSHIRSDKEMKTEDPPNTDTAGSSGKWPNLLPQDSA